MPVVSWWGSRRVRNGVIEVRREVIVVALEKREVALEYEVEGDGSVRCVVRKVRMGRWEDGGRGSSV